MQKLKVLRKVFLKKVNNSSVVSFLLHLVDFPQAGLLSCTSLLEVQLVTTGDTLVNRFLFMTFKNTGAWPKHGT